jgi:NADH dehydrogenase [ubiquinone] 1 alpha subcomplex assembly factor 7
MPNLEAIIKAEILHEGPLNIARYMQLCLFHPRFGYYITQNPLNQDFTTSPELSQVFGECLGLWAALKAQQRGLPAHFGLIEIGAGRGTMMRDMLRVLTRFGYAPNVHIVDINPVLRAAQKENLLGYNPTWHEALSSVPKNAALLVANEFLDCLPVRQFAARCERLVGVHEDKLLLGLSAPYKGFGAGEYEICEGFFSLCEELSNFENLHALFIDYGYGAGHGHSVQAMKEGAFVDILTHCGQADLTAHVDFKAFARAAQGANLKSSNLLAQHEFLCQLGFMERLEALMRKNPNRVDIQTQALKLIDISTPQSMGQLFKVMEIST